MTTEKYYNENDMNEVFNFELTKEQRQAVRLERNRILREEYHAFNHVVNMDVMENAFERAMMTKYYAAKK
ncbi:MAG: hypothetical protein GY870_04975 [archaeon]|nr:hypothetical protein [archaeon]